MNMDGGMNGGRPWARRRQRKWLGVGLVAVPLRGSRSYGLTGVIMPFVTSAVAYLATAPSA